jgi:hypothetical protein
LVKTVGPTLKTDAIKLLVNGQEMLTLGHDDSTAHIRRLRKHEEKIERLIQEVEKVASSRAASSR